MRFSDIYITSAWLCAKGNPSGHKPEPHPWGPAPEQCSGPAPAGLSHSTDPAGAEHSAAAGALVPEQDMQILWPGDTARLGPAGAQLCWQQHWC